MNQWWNVYFVCPSVPISRYISPSLFSEFSFNIYTYRVVSFVGNQHSTMAVDIYVGSYGQGTGEGDLQAIY
jgi:hypothetical protein